MIKKAEIQDIQGLMSLGHEANPAYYEKNLEEQAAGHREVYLAFQEEDLAGYVILNWQPRYQPFRRLGIPEIQDLFVSSSHRRQGIGEALVRHCEACAQEAGKNEMGIAVGLHAGFGAAQRLYIRMGYIPDGSGVTYDRAFVNTGEMRPVDDDLTLMLIKNLKA